jgi:hypothetical protein
MSDDDDLIYISDRVHADFLSTIVGMRRYIEDMSPAERERFEANMARHGSPGCTLQDIMRLEDEFNNAAPVLDRELIDRNAEELNRRGFLPRRKAKGA